MEEIFSDSSGPTNLDCVFCHDVTQELWGFPYVTADRPLGDF